MLIEAILFVLALLGPIVIGIIKGPDLVRLFQAPDKVQKYCKERGWSDLFWDRRRFWAFPSGGDPPRRILLKVRPSFIYSTLWLLREILQASVSFLVFLFGDWRAWAIRLPVLGVALFLTVSDPRSSIAVSQITIPFGFELAALGLYLYSVGYAGFYRGGIFVDPIDEHLKADVLDVLLLVTFVITARSLIPITP